ncbi:MFS transporter [Clostridium felsineum]|uniref:Enterobactin exporter EntS n=1 Tax=Clostridium felsineum TaxID=36839 RepID=A0A1S8M7I6_9CLOT|nr:MFS transporter [Clostridium felsineum]URZ06991.1 Enterobactin exporter EntS [Clostridium felsineum]URZ12021.1 Enterobactin exporter EntS [Clostridium felsineum]
MKNIYKSSNFIIYLIGIFISGIGTKLTTIALANKVTEFKGGAFNVNLIYIFESLPILILGMFVGNFIDKKNKKISFVVVNMLFAVTSFTFAITKSITTTLLIIILSGIFKAFLMPIETALIPLLLDKKNLGKANGLIMSISGIVVVMGYAFAGVLINLIGSRGAFILDGVSFILISILSLFFKLNEGSSEKLELKEDFISGFKVVMENENIKWIFLIDIFITFIISMETPLIYIFTANYLGGSVLMAKRVGFLFAFAGIGAIVGGIIFGRFQKKNKLFLLSACLIMDALIVIAFSVNTYFPLSLALFSVMGILDTFNGSILQTVIQEKTPENLLGRVSGFVNSIVQPISVLSLLIGSVASSFIEVKWIFIIASLLEFFIGILFLKKKF